MMYVLIPIFLEVKCMDAIWSRGFMRAQLEDNVLNLITCYWPVEFTALLSG